MAKIKTPIVFSGIKIIKDNSPPTNDDYKYARISKAKNWLVLYREFTMHDQPEIIEVSQAYHFCDLVRFFYKDYCCAIQEKDFFTVE